MVAPVNIELRAEDKTGQAFSQLERRLNKLNNQLDTISGRPIINPNQLDVRGVENVNRALQETEKQTRRAGRSSKVLGDVLGAVSVS